MATQNLLTIQNLKSILRALSPTEQSAIISKHLKNKIIMRDTDCYVINSDMVYEIQADCENKIISTVSKLIIDSYNHLDDNDKQDFMALKPQKIFTNASIKSYLPQLHQDLQAGDIKFDIYFSIIHFKNGYYDIKNKTFNKRILGEHYITNCISYDYKPSTVAYRNMIYKELKKIYPNEKVLSTILTIIGSALTGLSTRDTYMLFLIGNASAGKSTMLDLTKFTVECYVKQIKPDTFVEGKNTDKIVNTYHKCPYIRITWLNEPKDRKFDNTFLKSWADGECNAEKLYKEGSHDFRHYSLTFFTANNMPNINIDGGVKRRIRAYEHTSKFVDNKKDVNEKLNIFLKNCDLKNDFDNSVDLKLAFFDILAEHANKWLNNKKIDLPDEFKETAGDIIDSNDTIKDFVDGHLTITKNHNDRIGKEDMMRFFSAVYPNKHLQPLQLRKSLEEKNVNYSSKYRYGQVQGCFYCVKFRNDDDDDSVIDKNDSVIDAEYMKVKDHEAIIDNITKEHDKKYDDMRLDLDNTMEYVEKLKAYIEELKKKPTIKPEEKKPKKKATIKPEEKEPVEDDLFKQIDNNKFLDKKTKKIYKVYNNNEEINFDGNLF